MIDDTLPFMYTGIWLLGYVILVKFTTSKRAKWPWSIPDLKSVEARRNAERTSGFLFFLAAALPMFAEILSFKKG